MGVSAALWATLSPASVCVCAVHLNFYFQSLPLSVEKKKFMLKILMLKSFYINPQHLVSFSHFFSILKNCVLYPLVWVEGCMGHTMLHWSTRSTIMCGMVARLPPPLRICLQGNYCEEWETNLWLTETEMSEFPHMVTLFGWKFLLEAHISRLRACMRKSHICHSIQDSSVVTMQWVAWTASSLQTFAVHCPTCHRKNDRERELTHFTVTNTQMWSSQEGVRGHLSLQLPHSWLWWTLSKGLASV